MIHEHFKSPNTILANMTQEDFSNNNLSFLPTRQGAFFTQKFNDWILEYWVKGFHYENIYSSMEFQHRVHVELRKEFK